MPNYFSLSKAVSLGEASKRISIDAIINETDKLTILSLDSKNQINKFILSIEQNELSIKIK